MATLRISLASIAILAAAGCRSASTTWHRAPADLDERLTAIEQSRLAKDNNAPAYVSLAPHDGTGHPAAHATSTRMRRPSVMRGDAIVMANRALPSRDSHAPRDQGNSRRVTFDAHAAALTLGELNDESGAEEPDIEFADTTAADREARYLRRPPLDSFWETVKRDVKYMPSDLWRDTKRVYANPVNLVILGSAYGGALALQQTGVDDTVEDHYDDHHSFSHDWRDAFATAGNPGTHFALAGLWYLVGQQRGDEKTYEVGKTMFSALIINGLTVLASQAATWDRSPNGELGTFFSGHTSSSFVMASVLHEAYGHWVGIPMYGLASLVAVERLDSGEHYFSDVAMGAVVGTVIGHTVATGRDPEFFGWHVVPYVSESGASGVGLMKSY